MDCKLFAVTILTVTQVSVGQNISENTNLLSETKDECNEECYNYMMHGVITMICLCIAFVFGFSAVFIYILSFLRREFARTPEFVTNEEIELRETEQPFVDDESSSHETVNIPLVNLQIGSTIGVGEFGRVVEAQMRGYVNGNVAVKILKDGYTNDDLLDFLMEIETMKTIGKHENIIKYFGFSNRERPPYIVMEFAEKGNLRDFLRSLTVSENQESNSFCLKNEEKVRFAIDVASGMRYLETKNCIHRDLAARNVLVTTNLKLKISDFGLARILSANQDYYKKDTKAKLPAKWMAPESLTFSIYTKFSDVWSFGVLFWEIVTLGLSPYADIHDVKGLEKYLNEGYRMPQPKDCPFEFYLLMRNCWQYNPEERPTFLDLVLELQKLNFDEFLITG